jgi:hypothetical protein
VNDGVINSVLPTAAGSGAKASFGAVSGVVVDVTHGDSAPVDAVVQPAGSAGAVTPSKLWPHTAPGVPVGVAVGVLVGVPVAVPVGVLVGVFVGVGVPAVPHGMFEIVSTLTPVAETLLSDAILHFRLIIWPLAAAGSITVVVIYPPELPAHAMRPAIGLMNAVLIVAL